MGTAIGSVLPLGVGVALSPPTITTAVLLLSTPRGRANGIGFLAGWVAGLATAGTIALLLADEARADDHGHPAVWVGIAKLILGAGLLLLAVLQWRSPPGGEQHGQISEWTATLDTFTPGGSAALALGLTAVNPMTLLLTIPKNLLLITGAAADIAQTGVGADNQVIALAVFVVFGALGPGVPLLIYLTHGERSTTQLVQLRTWMTVHDAAITVTVLLIIGAKFVGDGIAGLA